jgi:hypothetical protein
VIIEKPLPPLVSYLGIFDDAARTAMVAAQKELRPIVAREAPHHSGTLARRLGPRLSKTRTGAALTVGAPRGARDGKVTLAELVRWTTRGTGIYREGPGPHRRIRARNPLRRMTLPGGIKRWSVRGQHAKPYLQRIAAAGTPRVEQASREGAALAVRRAEALS